MRDKTRNKFNATKQQVTDLLNGIKVAKPVISLIRLCGEKEREVLDLNVQMIFDNTSLEHLVATSALLRNNKIEESHEQKKLEEDIRKRYNNLTKKSEELSEEIEELKAEITEYLSYIEESFVWVAEDTLKAIVPKCISLCDEEEFLVMLLILFNKCFFEEYELLENEEVILDSLEYNSNKSGIVMEVNHNLENLVSYIKQN